MKLFDRVKTLESGVDSLSLSALMRLLLPGGQVETAAILVVLSNCKISTIEIPKLYTQAKNFVTL